MAALGILLMASAAALGAVLVHDGEVAGDHAVDLATAAPGESVSLKGTPEPFAPFGATRAWRSIIPVLANHTYTLDDPEAGVVAMLTSEIPAPDGVVLAEGDVGYVAPHPDGSGRLLVVIVVTEWREPLLFD